MRARNIKPGFFANEQLAECSLAARILFVGLWCLADRRGRLEDRPKRFKANIFPYDNFDVDDLVVELEQQDLIVRYEADEKRYIWIPKFILHQRPHSNETESIIPPCALELKMIERGELISEEEDRARRSKNNQDKKPSEPRSTKLVTKEESTCCQGEKHFGLNPDTGYLNPDTGYLNPDTGYLNPDTGYLNPDTGYLNPDTGYLNPDTGYLNPDTGYLNPENTNTRPLPEPGTGADAPHTAVTDCPHEAIVGLYHEILPMMPRVQVWNESRRSMLRTRWREDKSRQSLDWWRRYFETVAASDFLCGRCPPGKTGHPFMADLEWLIRPSNMPKVLEGKYSNREPGGGYQEAARMGYDEAKKQLNKHFSGSYGPLRDVIDVGGEVQST